MVDNVKRKLPKEVAKAIRATVYPSLSSYYPLSAEQLVSLCDALAPYYPLNEEAPRYSVWVIDSHLSYPAIE